MCMIYNYRSVSAFPYHLLTAGLPQSGILQPFVPIMSETDDDSQPYLAQLEFYPHSWNSPLTRECRGSAHYVTLRTMPFYIALLLACTSGASLFLSIYIFEWENSSVARRLLLLGCIRFFSVYRSESNINSNSFSRCSANL